MPLMYLSFIPLALVVAVVIASMAEADLREVPGRALRLWGILLAFGAAMLLVVMVAQEPGLIP